MHTSSETIICTTSIRFFVLLTLTGVYATVKGQTDYITLYQFFSRNASSVSAVSAPLSKHRETP